MTIGKLIKPHPEVHPLIKFLAKVAVDDFLEEQKTTKGNSQQPNPKKLAPPQVG